MVHGAECSRAEVDRWRAASQAASQPQGAGAAPCLQLASADVPACDVSACGVVGSSARLPPLAALPHSPPLQHPPTPLPEPSTAVGPHQRECMSGTCDSPSCTAPNNTIQPLMPDCMHGPMQVHQCPLTPARPVQLCDDVKAAKGRLNRSQEQGIILEQVKAPALLQRPCAHAPGSRHRCSHRSPLPSGSAATDRHTGWLTWLFQCRFTSPCRPQTLGAADDQTHWLIWLLHWHSPAPNRAHRPTLNNLLGYGGAGG